jgi:NhaP-type Na+/H+ or K+/H+ antiporter
VLRHAHQAARAGAPPPAVAGAAHGAVLLGPAIGDLTWQIALYAALSLSAIRMIPVAISMLGTGMRRPTVAFLGWFGPRGAASIVFALLLLEEKGGLAHEDAILSASFVTIGLSVLAHGVTAAPLAARYADWHDARVAETPVESGEEEELPWRLQAR